MVADSLTSNREKEFADLRRGRKSSILRIIFFGLVFLLAIGTFYPFTSNSGIATDHFDAVRNRLLQLDIEWSRYMVDDHESYSKWLMSRGTTGEVKAFNIYSKLLFQSMLLIAKYFSLDFTSLTSNVLSSLHLGLLRVGFMAVVIWRLLLFLILGSLFWPGLTKKVYEQEDLLGSTGNGRHFFSGIKVKLENLTAHGAPDMHITGLACPKTAPENVAKNSTLGKLLAANGLLNKTNLHLVQIISHYAKWPAFLVYPEHSKKLEEEVINTTLLKASTALISIVIDNLTNANVDRHQVNATDFNKPYAIDEYVQLVEKSFTKSLSPIMKEALLKIRPEVIVTSLLAMQAGKIFTYSFEAGRWIIASNFTQLSARAIMHSLPSYGKEYDYFERQLMRRSLIYASRASAFGPVRFPANLSLEERALRQWTEIIHAEPFRLQQVTDEVELFGMVNELNQAWGTALIKDILENGSPEYEVVALQGSTFFMQLHHVVKLFDQILSPGKTQYLEDLINRVYHSQNFQNRSLMIEEGESPTSPQFEKIFAPLTSKEIEHLADEHNVPKKIIRKWSSLRVILNTVGWLGRRVGDCSVPENSLIFLAYEDNLSASTSDNLLSKDAIVVFRATRLKDEWDSSWNRKFTITESAIMAENRDDLASVLAGKDTFEDIEE